MRYVPDTVAFVVYMNTNMMCILLRENVISQVCDQMVNRVRIMRDVARGALSKTGWDIWAQMDRTVVVPRAATMDQ